MTKAITKETLLPLSMVISLFVGWQWLDNRLDGMAEAQVAQFAIVNTAQQKVEWRLAQIEKRLDEATNDRWRRDDMAHWVRELGLSNASLVVPPH